MRGYAARVRLYLGPYLGEVLLAELTTGHVQAMVAAIIRQHHALGTPVSAATLTRIRATLRAALNAAIRSGLITENPAAKAELALAAGVDLRVVQDMRGHSSIVLTADTYTSVLPAVACTAAEKVATLIIRAGCLVPGTRRRRRRQGTRNRRSARAGGRRTTMMRRSRAHPARQLGRPTAPSPATQTPAVTRAQLTHPDARQGPGPSHPIRNGS